MIYFLSIDIKELSMAVLGVNKTDLELEEALHHELTDNKLQPEETIDVGPGGDSDRR